MTNSGIKLNDTEYKNQISEIIQKELTDLHGSNGYKSIIETMSKICGKTEKEIITNYELFAELTEGVFGRLANSKILDHIKLEIDKIGMENIYQGGKEVVERPRCVRAYDKQHNIFKKLEKINLNQEERNISTKLSEVMTVLQTHRY